MYFAVRTSVSCRSVKRAHKIQNTYCEKIIYKNQSEYIYSPRPDDCENCDASVRARDEPFESCLSRDWLFVSVFARCEFLPPPAEPPLPLPLLLPDPLDECK